MKTLTDKERLDFLDNLTSMHHRGNRPEPRAGQILLQKGWGGWKLQESQQEGYSKVRDAIDAFANMAAN